MYRHFLALRHASRRMISSTACRQVENKVPRNQKLFQEDNDVPIHLKGGTKDAVLYTTTMVLTVLGTGYIVYELYSAAMPKKN